MSLRIGRKGEDIKNLQSQLGKLGYALVLDGVFGYATLQAVRDFQQRKGLAVDGVVGAATKAHILLALGTVTYPQTEHFKIGEFISPNDADAMRCGIPYAYFESVQVLMARLEVLRKKIGGLPIIIRSGYRSPKHNRAVGGATHSQHLFAKAADIYVKDHALSTYALGKLIMEDYSLKALFGGIGLGSQKNIHLDIRAVKNTEKPTVWWYGNKSWESWGNAT